MEELDFPELDSIRIPDKTHFKIGEVAKLLDLEPYVLRYWEKEFDVLEPDKTDSGQRAYQRDDIELLATIQKLLYTEMFTIDGARRQLELAQKGEPSYLTSTLGDGDAEELSDENDILRQQLADARRTIEQLEAENRRLEKVSPGLEGDSREVIEALSGHVEALTDLTR